MDQNITRQDPQAVMLTLQAQGQFDINFKAKMGTPWYRSIKLLIVRTIFSLLKWALRKEKKNTNIQKHFYTLQRKIMMFKNPPKKIDPKKNLPIFFLLLS